MTFNGACKISILAQLQQIFVAPLLFSWTIIIHHILEVSISPISILLIGAIITVYQQFSANHEDITDGFFDHCRFNGLHLLSYALAKSFSILITVLLPMTAILFVLGIGLVESLLIFSQWGILSICITCILTFMNHANPVNLLLAWLPLLTAPFVFLSDFLQTMNGNSLLILLGCDTILISAICMPFSFRKN